MKYLILLFAILVFFQHGCGPSKEQIEQAKEFERREANGIAKIKIADTGDIYMNKKLTSLDALSEELLRIKQVDGVVWYYRGSPARAAEATGMLVVDEIVKYKLPVKMCEKDFE